MELSSGEWEDELRRAAWEGRAELVRELLDGAPPGADLDARDGRGGTALIWAAASGGLAICELLVLAGADASLRNDHGRGTLNFGGESPRPVTVGEWSQAQGLFRAGCPALKEPQTRRLVIESADLSTTAEETRARLRGAADECLGRTCGLRAHWREGRQSYEGRVWLLPDEADRVAAALPSVAEGVVGVHLRAA